MMSCTGYYYQNLLAWIRDSNFLMNSFLTICFGSNWVLMFDLVCGLPVGIFLTAASATRFWLARRPSLDCEGGTWPYNRRFF